MMTLQDPVQFYSNGQVDLPKLRSQLKQKESEYSVFIGHLIVLMLGENRPGF